MPTEPFDDPIMERNRAVMALIESWLRDESVFPELKRALEESRGALGTRPPFDAG